MPKVVGLPIQAIPMVSLEEAAFCGSRILRGDILYTNHGAASGIWGRG